MQITLIICTFMRPEPLLKLLQSVQVQSVYPSEILIIDGSTNNETTIILKNNNFQNCKYFQVEPQFRGLTKQRNFGIEKVSKNSEIVAFVDDDTHLNKDYFEQLIKTFTENKEITGVGGVAVNENSWVKFNPNINYNKYKYELFEGFAYKEGQRNVVRKFLGLQSHLGAGRMPEYSHGKTCGFPLTDKIYEVDLLVGLSFAFRKIVFENIKFSTYFEGYGLYEDADFSIRALQFGKNVINTKLQLQHFHNPSGRPNQFKYGKMVVRNGWYVWRIKNSNPTIKEKFKWHLITILLTLIRFSNVFTTNQKKEAVTEFLGRTIGWFSVIFRKPIIK
jgi:GT2 family glycosyltransferase